MSVPFTHYRHPFYSAFTIYAPCFLDTAVRLDFFNVLSTSLPLKGWLVCKRRSVSSSELISQLNKQERWWCLLLCAGHRVRLQSLLLVYEPGATLCCCSAFPSSVSEISISYVKLKSPFKGPHEAILLPYSSGPVVIWKDWPNGSVILRAQHLIDGDLLI